jgi:hypothetical protein
MWSRLRPEHPKYVMAKYRARRWEQLRECFPDIEQMRLLDLGGTTGTWSRQSWHPKEVLAVNLDGGHDRYDTEWAKTVVADATELPPELFEQQWDIVFSNSVIEHVGGAVPRRRFAEAVHALAPSYWIQTPYRYFPLEPHWWFPGFQFLPLAVKARATALWPLGSMQTDGDKVERSLEVELLSRTEMRSLFPEGGLLSERALGLTKSLIAYRQGRPYEAPTVAPAAGGGICLSAEPKQPIRTRLHARLTRTDTVSDMSSHGAD